MAAGHNLLELVKRNINFASENTMMQIENAGHNKKFKNESLMRMTQNL